MELRKLDYGTIISIIAAAFWLGKIDSKVRAVDTEKIDEIEERLREIDQKTKRLEQTTLEKIIASIERLKEKVLIVQETKKLEQMPVGTIIASMLKPDIFFSKVSSNDWRLADSSRIPQNSIYKELISLDRAPDKVANLEDWNHLQLNLPDLRGVFLRGMNSGRNDGKGCPKDEDLGRVAGSYQTDSTARPSKDFTGKSSLNGEHTHHHKAPRGYDAGSGDRSRAKADGESDTNPAGNHSHTITIDGGGDPETRPVNVAVYFYIKIN